MTNGRCMMENNSNTARHTTDGAGGGGQGRRERGQGGGVEVGVRMWGYRPDDGKRFYVQTR